MYKYRPFYQLVFFVNHNVAPSPDILSSLLSGYGGFTPCPVNAGTVLLKDDSKMREIVFEPEKISITEYFKYGIPEIPGDDVRRKFTWYAVDALNIFYDLTDAVDNSCPGYRMGLVTRLFFEGTGKDRLDGMAERFVHVPGTHRENMPCEWSVRQCSRDRFLISDREEIVNAVSTVGRSQGFFNMSDSTHKDFDSIDIMCDFNTSQHSHRQRFSARDAEDFLLNSAFVWVDKMERETEETVRG
jgi:hypothetical protein